MLKQTILISALLVLLLLQVEACAGSIEGRLAYRKGDYATALHEFDTVDQGGPVSTFFLAP